MDFDSRQKKAFGKMDTTGNLPTIINAPIVHVPFKKSENSLHIYAYRWNLWLTNVIFWCKM